MTRLAIFLLISPFLFVYGVVFIRNSKENSVFEDEWGVIEKGKTKNLEDPWGNWADYKGVGKEMRIWKDHHKDKGKDFDDWENWASFERVAKDLESEKPTQQIRATKENGKDGSAKKIEDDLADSFGPENVRKANIEEKKKEVPQDQKENWSSWADFEGIGDNLIPKKVRKGKKVNKQDISLKKDLHKKKEAAAKKSKTNNSEDNWSNWAEFDRQRKAKEENLEGQADLKRVKKETEISDQEQQKKDLKTEETKNTEDPIKSKSIQKDASVSPLWVLRLKEEDMNNLKLRRGSPEEEKDFLKALIPTLAAQTRPQIDKPKDDNTNSKKAEQDSKSNGTFNDDVTKVVNKFVSKLSRVPESNFKDFSNKDEPFLVVNFKGPHTSVTVKQGRNQWNFFINPGSPFPEWFYQPRATDMEHTVPSSVKTEFYKVLVHMLKAFLNFPV